MAYYRYQRKNKKRCKKNKDFVQIYEQGGKIYVRTGKKCNK